MSEDVLEKVVRTTEVAAGSGGLLNPDQANRFIDYMWDATVLGQQVRTIRMRANTADIDKVNVGERLMRLATEAVDTGVNAGATFTKVSITTVKLRMDFEISTESLEDNIEGDALEDHIARLMATQAGNDIEDVSINGDVSQTSVQLINALDGWSVKALAGAHVVDQGGAALNRAAFNAALKKMPRKFMQNRAALKFFSGSNLIQDYRYGLTQTSSGLIDLFELAGTITTQGPVKPEGKAGFSIDAAYGLRIQEVPLFNEAKAGTYSGASGNHGELWLTYPQNLLVGIKREVQVYREFRPKKDTTEYTVYVRTGVQIENTDAFVVVKNIKVQS